MAAPDLRDYQEKHVRATRAAMRRARRIIMQAPTGAGKSVMISYMIARAAERGLSAWLICHRQELLDQLSGTLWQAGVNHGVIMSGRTPTRHPIQIASIQTLVRRLGKLRPPDMLAIDECHHATATSYLKTIAACPKAFVIGLTATPSRTDGRGLGDVFEEIVDGPSVGELIERGFLSKYRVIAPREAMDVSSVHIRGGDFARGELSVAMDKRAIIGDAVEHYKKYVAPKSCLVYCVSRMHAQHVTEGYRDAGIDARYVAGDTEKSERVRIIRGFKAGRIPVIVSVDLFGEGLDCPGLTAVQLLRPTQSLGLHLQQIGRALRVEPGKDCAIILDHVGNTWRHGLPDDEREWSLEGRKKQKKKAADDAGPNIRHCEKCFAVFRAAPTCPVCGHEIEVKGREVEEVDGELLEVDPEEHRQRRQQTAAQRRRKAQERAATAGRDGVDLLEQLTVLAVERDYKPGWAARKYTFQKTGKFDHPDLDKVRAKETEIRERLQAERKAS